MLYLKIKLIFILITFYLKKIFIDNFKILFKKKFRNQFIVIFKFY